MAEDRKAKSTFDGEKPARPPGRGAKKWSLWRHWKRASHAKRLKWILTGVGSAVGVGVLAVYVWDHVQNERHFIAENRPKLLLAGAPAFLGPIQCVVSERSIHLYTGAIRIFVKNFGKGEAVSAFVNGPEFQLVPEKKVGDPFYDEPPSITDQTCRNKVSPKMKMFSVYSGQGVYVDLAQTEGVISLIKTKSVTLTFGIPPQEPEPPTGEKPSKRVPFDKDTRFQLYAPVCVYYDDGDGLSYGSCNTYRVNFNGRFPFACSETPLSGATFQMTIGNYCDN